MTMTAKEAVAREIFAGMNGDPDWDDGYETAEQAVKCADDDLSQEECMMLSGVVLAFYHKWLSENGWQIVPKEPTQKMLDDGWASAHMENAEGTWRDMLAAAPKPTIE